MNEVTIEKTDGRQPNTKNGTLWAHHDGEVFILSKLDTDAYALVSLDDGNRWYDMVSEPDHVFGSMKRMFTQITTGSVTLTPKP
jgi:hypothetical protein